MGCGSMSNHPRSGPATPPHSNGVFITTRWTQVLAARGDSETARLALSELCSAYYAPVLSFLTHTGCGPEDPRDVAHGFFAALLERDCLADVQQDRGRFRSYLLGALKHFVANRRLHASREKRGAAAEHLSLESGSDTWVELPLVAQLPQMDALFDHEWAVAVVERALAELQQEATAAGSLRQFTVLKAWLSFDADPGSQLDAATRLGINEGAVKVAVHRLRRRFRELVRSEITQTIPAGDDLDAELRHLMDALMVEPGGNWGCDGSVDPIPSRIPIKD